MGMIKEYYAFPNAADRSKDINRWLDDLWAATIPNRKRYPVINKYMIINDRVEEVKDVVVYEFQMGDVEDPDLYAAQPMMEWQESDAGQWVMRNAIDVPEWFRMADPISYGYKYQIRAKLTGPALTEWLLRHGSK